MRKMIVSIAFALCAAVTASAVCAAEALSPKAPSESSQPVVAVSKINLNTANAEVLQRELSGVGAVKAQAIVSYREQNGNFESVEELLEVKGIGEALLEKNREKISVN
ncbi:helix-hairpin-helix domain-containing protein [Ectopseudomonas mendocina]|uniref:Helix-hairpin-helix domain-containing protein n=1 Tax=Ectopseudomonas mendocina TaxID=300 RepID=A0ABZ2RKQ6_ECTME